MSFEPMPDELARTLVREAHGAAPDEMCGFIMSGWNFLPIPNCHPEPSRYFEMNTEMMLEVLQDNAHNVLGIYHSHPRGNKEPSGYDAGMMRNYSVHGFRFWIVTYNNVYEWRIHRDNPTSVRRDGTNGSTELAYPVLTTPAPL
jgi:proteasome lid subunit RPN8/RPN11